MNPKNRDFRFFLEDMLLAMGNILKYTESIEFEDFIDNQLIIDATIRNFEIIGEAAKHIPKNITLKYPHIPWQKMYGLRNLISHVYFGIDHEMIWEIISTELRKNQMDLAEVIEIEFNKK